MSSQVENTLGVVRAVSAMLLGLAGGGMLLLPLTALEFGPIGAIAMAAWVFVVLQFRTALEGFEQHG